MPTHVALDPHCEDFIHQMVESGRYPNTSEVVRAALRLLEEREAEQAMKLQALREAIAVGLASGEGIPEEEVFDRLDAKYRAMVEKAP